MPQVEEGKREEERERERETKRAIPSKKIKGDETVSDKNKGIMSGRSTRGPKMKQIIPLSPPHHGGQARPTAISSFRPDIYPFHPESSG